MTQTADDDLQQLGERIRDRMKALGLTQADLAAACDVSQAAISKIVNGTRGPSRKLLGELATALQTTTAWVLTGKDSDLPAAQGQPLPQGLETFLERHGAKEQIDERERWYLANSRFKAEEWVAFDDEFWHEMLQFWRTYLGRKLAKKSPSDFAGLEPKRLGS